MDKRKLIYVSPDCFFDTDYLVIKHLSKYYNITWFALTTITGTRSVDFAEIEKNISGLGVDVRVKKLAWRKRSLRQLKFDLDLLREIKSVDADLIYVEDVGDLYFFGLQPLFFKKSKVVYGLHDVTPHKKKNDISSNLEVICFNLMRSLLFGWCDNYHIFSKTEYVKFFNANKRKNAFFTQLMIKQFGSSDLKPDLKQRECRFLFFGQIEYYKGLDLLINAVEGMVDEGFGSFGLTIAGKGDHWPVCEKLIVTESVYNLKIGYVKDEDIPDLFSSHHFLILPYRDASQSGPQVIALQYDLPVVASNVNGLTDAISNQITGFVFESGNVKSLKSILEDCIKMNQTEYDDMKTALNKWTATNYRIEDNIVKYKSFFDSLLKL